MPGNAQWIAPRDLRPAARMRLFCLPHAGSGASVFYRWRGLLPAGVDVCPVQLPGRELRLREPPAASVEAVVEGLLEGVSAALDVPYAIFGHSMGALLGFEWLRAIETRGLPAPRLLIVSGRTALQLPYPWLSVASLPEDSFLDALDARYGGLPAAVRDEPELRALFVPVLRADLGLVERYRHAPGPRTEVPMLAVAGISDPAVPDAGLAAWGDLTRGDFRSARLPGGHFYHLEEGQAALLALMGERFAGHAHG